jgi:hypothetical protein
MITADPRVFLEHLATLTPDPARALPRGVMIILPEQFYVETQTARDNVYVDTEAEADPRLAWRETEALAQLVESVGLPVRRFPGRAGQPDGVFSNNVFATVPGRLVVGSMLHPIRRLEADREDIRDWILVDQGYELVELSRQHCVAELTGALVIDRSRNVGFCGMSQRVDEVGLAAMHEALGLDLTFRFDLNPDEYHTNVVLTVLAGRACVIHPGAFPDPAVAETLAAAFPGRCLEISEAEKVAFVANCIALTDADLFMSAAADAALSDHSRATLTDWGFTIHSTDLSELELAGGSLRCMITEIF